MKRPKLLTMTKFKKLLMSHNWKFPDDSDFEIIDLTKIYEIKSPLNQDIYHFYFNNLEKRLELYLKNDIRSLVSILYHELDLSFDTGIFNDSVLMEIITLKRENINDLLY